MSGIRISLKDLIEGSIGIDYPNEVITIHFDVQGLLAQFQNRIFKCKKLIFEHISNSEYNFKFDECSFDCEIEFTNFNLDEISFKNTKSIKSLTLQGKDENNKSILKSFKFHYDKEYSEVEPKPKLCSNFYISNLLISDNLLVQNIDHIAGKFEFIGNELGGKGIDAIVFANSNFCNAHFLDNDFKDETSFGNTSFKYNLEDLETPKENFNYTRFYNNIFKKVSFTKAKFIDKCKFYKCDFLSTTWFENCENLINSKLKFVACEFKGFSLFNDSKINFLNIDRCTFDKSSSFKDATFNILNLNEVKFGGGAYFDEMKINKVLDKSYLKDESKILEWKRTLRAIKQESQKTENRFDSNRFRAYELAAHYEELNSEENFKDVTILWATKISTDFGLSWTKAFWFIVKGGILFYAPLYLIENWDAKIKISSWDNWSRLFSGFFRFLLVTDFYNPLETDRIYLTNPFSWIILIFGKIVVAFGIYEMIQSFRKFKA